MEEDRKKSQDDFEEKLKELIRLAKKNAYLDVFQYVTMGLTAVVIGLIFYMIWRNW